MARGLRIVGGSAGGRRLVAPKGGARPTTDRVKEALFNVLGAHAVDASVLDLYAGSGALGIEALSRGAASSEFVDTDAAAVAAIRENLDAAVQADPARDHRLARVAGVGVASPLQAAGMAPPACVSLASRCSARRRVGTTRGLVGPRHPRQRT